MKYIRNPITSIVRQVSPLEAKRLLAYGWVRATAIDHHLYYQEVAKATVEMMKRKGEKHRRLQ